MSETLTMLHHIDAHMILSAVVKINFMWLGALRDADYGKHSLVLYL